MSRLSCQFWWRSLTAVLTVVSLVLSARLQAADQAANPAAAEPANEAADYEVMPLPAWALSDTPQDKKRRNDLDIRKETILRGSEPFNSQETKDFLQGYYARYYFALLTHPKHIGDWPDFRVKFLRSLSVTALQEAPLLQVHDFLVETTYQAMIPLIKGNYHPAVRCNAMLLLSQLNSQDALLVGDRKRPAVPLIQALKVMLDELASPKQIDGVRAAALVGTLRHVDIDRQLPSGQRRLVGNAENLIADTMVKLVNEKQPPEGRSQAGHDWMRRRAVEVLGTLGSPGQNNSVVTALDGVLTDINSAVSLRCAAAEALGRLRLPANANLAVADTAKKLASVAVFACKKEAQRVEDQEAREAKDKLQSMPGAGYAMGGYGGYMDGGYGSMMPGAMPGMMPDTTMPGDMAGMMPGAMPGMMPGYGMPGYGAPAGQPAKKFNPLGYRILLTRRRIAHEMLLVKRGLLGPDATLKAAPAAAAPKTGSAAPPKAGLAALAKAADQAAIDDAVAGIDAIIGVVEQSSFNEMKSLIAELRGKVRQMEDKCGIVVELPQAIVPGAGPEGLPANTLELPPEIPGLDLPAMPGQAPAEGPAEKAPAVQGAAGKPAAAPPAGKPAAGSPAAKPPTAPGPGKPPAAGPGPAPAAPPAGQPPAAPTAPGATPPAAAPPAGNAPAAAGTPKA